MRTYNVWPGAMIALATWMGCTSIAGIDGVFQHDNEGASGASGSGNTGGGGGAGGAGSVCVEGAVEDCYDGPDGTQDVGVCAAGTKTCVAGQWGACDKQVHPSDELCNGLDDDCDGAADEELPSKTCGLGACTVTVEGCKDGVVQECIPLQGKPDESCDGTDDNCDGQVDEGCSCVNGATQACYTGSAGTRNVGACADGVQTCADGKWGSCEGEVLPESAESCDGVDNDCDNSVDEELAPIICGVGACQAIVQSCENGAPKICVPGQPKPETCNLIDDDCNGQTDDGLGTISCGAGECVVVIPACSGGSPGMCVPKMPTSEVCDGKDNDCNGTADNGNPGGGLACDTGKLGICAAGSTSCTNGTIACNQTKQPSPETCNNLDDNCNGSKDENLGSTTCGIGACMVTVQNCVGGQTQTCTPKAPVPEVCNNIDDDCDGMKDENLGSTTCGVGACMVVQENCVNGQPKQCIPKAPVPEVCNNIDDDCDGVVDDGVKTTYYRDADGDGYGDPAQSIQACLPQTGYVTNSSDCNDGNATIKPGATDLPDDAFVDSNCDGIDGTESAAIFVAPPASGGNDLNLGTKTQPVATITKAIQIVKTTPGKTQILVSEGTYTGRVILVSGSIMAGGYRKDAPMPAKWARASTYTKPIIESTSDLEGRRSAVEGYNITTATMVDRFVIRTSATNTPNTSNYAMYLKSSGGVTLKNSDLFSGNAGPGTNGVPGMAGGNGGDGSTGGPGSCAGNIPGDGGLGGSSPCGMTGGAGGQGGGPHNNGSAGSAGVSGTAGGAGGPKGSPTPGGNGGNGNPGLSGGAGANGSSGSNDPSISVIGGYWSTLPGNGASGVNGNNGNGGGGGGGGGGEDCSIQCNNGSGNGGSGGGGGGCGGLFATGGTAGGGSFALFLANSSGVVLTNCTFKSGNGGIGGNGAAGGSGGLGGSGAASNNFCDQVGAGGLGGNGGNGGDGGDGAGAAGGPSIAVFRFQSTITQNGTNLFSPSPASSGGSSPGNAGPSGLSQGLY